MAEIKYMWNFFKGLNAWNLESDKKLECMGAVGTHGPPYIKVQRVLILLIILSLEFKNGP